MQKSLQKSQATLLLLEILRSRDIIAGLCRLDGGVSAKIDHTESRARESFRCYYVASYVHVGMNPYQVAGILVIKKVQGNTCMQIRDRYMYVVRVVPPTVRVGIIAANAARASSAGRQKRTMASCALAPSSLGKVVGCLLTQPQHFGRQRYYVASIAAPV